MTAIPDNMFNFSINTCNSTAQPVRGGGLKFPPSDNLTTHSLLNKRTEFSKVNIVQEVLS